MTRAERLPFASAGYDRIAQRFDAERGPKPGEWRFFRTLGAELVSPSRVLDCGCGSGHSALVHLLEAGHEILGLDGSAEMLDLFGRRYPSIRTVHADMRDYKPDARFDALIAWDSLFHLSHTDQVAMIERFGEWISPGGRLLFTSGPNDGSVEGDMFGVAFFYASFDEAGYRASLAKAGFDAITSAFDEPDGDVHKVWTARRAA